MMMEKPRPKAAVAVAEEKSIKKKSAEEAVEELEKRLAALGGPSPEIAVTADDDLLNLSAEPAVAAAAPPPETPKEVKGGKNALLARIMAAQEKTKPVPPPPPASLVFGPPPTMKDAPPPPAYDTGFLPPPTEQLAAPPAFDAVEDSVMAHVQQPPAYTAMAPPAASAPAFEDLLGVHALPPPQQKFVPAPPPSEEEEIIMGMEGLSPEERNALMEEQRTIMQQIEREKSANHSAIAAVQADNFDMRSTTNAVNAISSGNSRAPTMRPPPGAETGSKVNLGGGQEVALHGPERTKEAIKEGTAILVQCVNCENWMQVTGNATLMYCPVCAVVSPVAKENAAMSKEEALQMEADRKMAEQLQSEEYEERPARQPPVRQAAAAPAQVEESWWDTVTGMFSTDTKSEAPPPPMQSLPSSNERQSLTGSPARARQGARIAEQKPLFSCVVDSVNSTVGTFTGQLSQDTEGNVHGVDASSLLAVSNVGRDSEYQQLNQQN